MKIVLSAIDKPLADAWRKYTSDFDFVEVIETNIFDAGCEAIVSPANSYGFMDGGIDWLYTQKFGWIVQERLQKKIKEEFGGELLVGQATMVPTDNKDILYLISAPTMRIPVSLGNKTVNPYLAARATFICAKENNIQSIVMPGLGTGVGNVPPEVCALQVKTAIEEIILGEYVFPVSWHDALDRHTYLYTGLRSRPNIAGLN
jgi:O-acetyl-ADP-ribose deacetylase (regulator of RNase III)